MNSTIYQNGEYLAYNPHWHAADAPHKARWIAALLGRNGLSPRRVVDIGSGSGDVLVELAKHYPRAAMQGYEVSPQAHAMAAPKAGGKLSFFHGDYPGPAGEKPDLAMAIDVIEHVEDYFGFVRALQPIAAWKVLHIPLDLSVQGLLRGTPINRARALVGHLHYFDKDTALATLADCGHTVVDWSYTHGAETMPDRLSTRALNVFRRVGRAVHEDFSVRVFGGASLMVLTR